MSITKDGGSAISMNVREWFRAADEAMRKLKMASAPAHARTIKCKCGRCATVRSDTPSALLDFECPCGAIIHCFPESVEPHPAEDKAHELTFMKLQLKATRAEARVEQLSCEVKNLQEALAKHGEHLRRIYDTVIAAVTATYLPIEHAVSGQPAQPDRAEDGKAASMQGQYRGG